MFGQEGLPQRAEDIYDKLLLLFHPDVSIFNALLYSWSFQINNNNNSNNNNNNNNNNDNSNNNKSDNNNSYNNDKFNEVYQRMLYGLLLLLLFL